MKYKSEFGFDEDIYDYVGTVENQILYALSGISYPDSDYEIRRKNAICYSFEYVYSGNGTIQENDKMYNVSTGDFFILHPNCYHHYYANPKNPWKKIFIMIDGDITLPRTLLNQYSIADITVFPQINTPIMLEEIYELFKSDNTNISQKLEILLCSMIIKLAHMSKKNVSDFMSINKAKKFIDKKINTKIELDEVAQYANISVSFLCREFKKAFGATPHNYILNSKIELAKTMLTETSLPIHLISDRFTFTDIAHFSRAFTKIVGMSPSAFREQNKE